PLHLLIWRMHYQMNLVYSPSPGHLWFLGNIFAYVLMLSPLFYYLMKNQEKGVALWLKKLLSSPFGLLIPALVLVAEAEIVNPRPFELYAMTWHGFFLGLFAFFFGFCFVFAGLPFRKLIERWWFIWFLLAVGSFVYRSFILKSPAENWLLSLESYMWVLSMLALAGMLFTKPSKLLSYLSQAAYPVYILHMIFLYLASHLLFNLELPPPVIFLLVLIFTLAGCFLSFELIKKIKFLRPLFGLKMD
ncbi:MAG TPA: acyltransferase family protein, partial [Saprospiraceae bacterium]|nr:acyltransferase family protein [Saprospiraceae bacterium]